MIGRVISGRYQIEAEIGQGGMAIIYRAVDLKSQQKVAMKVLREQYVKDSEFLRRFQREAYAMMKIYHPNIVQVYNVGCDGDIHYIVMELVEGPTLKEYLQQKGKLPVKEAVQIMMDLCAGLQTAHDDGVIHRDIKPHNVMITKEGKVKMTDFGIAKVAGSATVTLSGENVLGSVHYIAPEQAQGKEIDEKTDIYSLGITLYEMLTGQLPFDADTTVSVALKHIQEPMVPACEVDPEIPYSLSACILKACAKDAALRYESPSAFAEDLHRSLLLPDGHFADLPEDGQRPVFREEAEKKEEHAEQRHDRSPKKNIAHIAILITTVFCILLTLFFMGQAMLSNSSGDLIAVPEVRNLNSAAAQNEFIEAQLQVTITYASSDTVPEDHVISQSEEPGTLVRERTNVRIVVSTGPEQILVPDLTGRTVEQAIEALDAAGLKLGNIIEVSVPDRADGIVVRQQPTQDASVPKGDDVDVYVTREGARPLSDTLPSSAMMIP